MAKVAIFGPFLGCFLVFSLVMGAILGAGQGEISAVLTKKDDPSSYFSARAFIFSPGQGL
jgi:hypothetical protein